MGKIDDMDLFVRVVKAEGLAAAGRQIGLSPASMTARLNALEQRYNTRLLHRTTRRLSLTDAGQRFYNACLRVLEEVRQAEALLHSDETSLSGTLRITAPSDFGRQYIAPALSEFVRLHPAVTPYLHLTDGIVNLVEHGYDLGIRYGNLPDSNMIARPLGSNHRVLVASPSYLKAKGLLRHPDDLADHDCLVMERLGEFLNDWQFHIKKKRIIIRVVANLSSNDGAIIRYWAVAGKGIAYKSIWDVQQDIEAGHLQTILDQYVLGFHTSDEEKTGLQLVYPDRKYLPIQVTEFSNFLTDYLKAMRSA